MTTSNECMTCRYGNTDGYCGKGLKSYDNDCSGRVVGDRAVASEQRLRLTLPVEHALIKAHGCFIPVHYVSNTYDIIIPRVWTTTGPGLFSNANAPGAQALEILGLFMYENPILLSYLRYECLFDRDYNGKPYTCDVIGTGTPCMDVIKRDVFCRGFHEPVSRGISIGVRVTVFHVQIHLSLTYCQGKHQTLAGYSNGYDLPPHYWWLDITLQPQELVPMHSLLRAIFTLVEKHASDSMGRVLKMALRLGLELKGRPISEWRRPIGNMCIYLFRSGILSEGRLMYLWDFYNQISGV